MDVVRPLDTMAVMSPLWLIEVDHPTQGRSSFLQAEGPNGTYLLVFTSARKANLAIQALGVEHGTSTCFFSDVRLELATALCQVGARGILVDFDPESQKAAFSRDLVARA